AGDASSRAAETDRTAASPATLEDTSGNRFEIMLASVQSDLPRTATQPQGEDKVADLTQPETPEDAAVVAALSNTQEEVREVWPGAIELFAQRTARQELRQEAEAAARAAMDIRYITGSVVNMRGGPGTEYQKITSLTEGTEVAVLQSPGNGWLELQVVDTGQTGWMADWLVSAAAN
ncbi:MAG: SH3 domain-containing protein, partial [Pseudomonadota bacterium]